ncbi:MAG: DUF58 domain-containing protein [bacterium]
MADAARRVAPAEILRRVRRIEITTRSVVQNVFAGEYKSVFKGRGMEFDEVREYLPGDDVRAIDWNVSARMNHLFVKRFVEERELTVMLVVDISGSAEFGTRGSLKSDVEAEIAGLLAFAAQRNNDKIGLMMFSDRVEKFIPPRKGLRHALRIVRDVVYHAPEGRGTKIAAALDHLNRVMDRRAIVFLISDFRDRGYEKILRATARRHDLVALWITDRRERELPKHGLLQVEDPETGEEALVRLTPKRVEAYRRLADAERRETERAFRVNRIESVAISTEASYIEPLVAFFKKRERMLR